MPEVRRVVLDIIVYDALKAEALVRHDNLKNTLASMVLENLSPDTHDVLKCIRDKKAPKASNATDECGAAPVADISPKRQKLAENQTALTRIKELWQSGEHNAAKIAREINYARGTVWENIRKMKERGEISD